MATLWGIDYGKKLSGNTVICIKKGSGIEFLKAEKDQDADRFILEQIEHHTPRRIFIDAPLTLPGAYYDNQAYDDFFFRQCDQQLGAMSPMFLGGLTARAIRLKNLLSAMNIELRETYPKALASQLRLKKCGYRRGKENLDHCCERIMESSDLYFDKTSVISWHHLDALLALISAFRHEQKLSYTFGDPGEGQIHI
ncbi:MAG: hypothetical protein KGY60_03950 [Bacteroidales bacterium]|nr:hypothetical protein [Bacteroidales bacterium]